MYCGCRGRMQYVPTSTVHSESLRSGADVIRPDIHSTFRVIAVGGGCNTPRHPQYIQSHCGRGRMQYAPISTVHSESLRSGRIASAPTAMTHIPPFFPKLPAQSSYLCIAHS